MKAIAFPAPILSGPILCASILCASILSTGLEAQAAPCLRENDANNTVSNAITASAFAGYGEWAYQYTPQTTVVARAMRVFTGNTFSESFMKLAVWTHDTVANAPGKLVAEGTWKNPKPTSPDWFGTNFDQDVLLLSNTTYWFVWSEAGFSTPPIEPAGTTLMATARRYGGSGTWTAGAAQALKFRIYCSYLDGVGLVAAGRACTDNGGRTGSLFTNTAPTVGNALFRLEATGVPSNATAILAFGIVPNFPGIPLGNLAPGCDINTDIVATVTGKSGTGNPRSTTDAANHVYFLLPIPNIPSIKGVFVGTQIAVQDAASKNAIPAVFTNALRITIQ